MYDLARVSCMLDKFDDAQKFLTNALHEKAIPPMSVYFVEPDFNFVRGATWFKGLGSANDSSSESVLKKTLLSMGFSLTSKNDTLRFPLCNKHTSCVAHEYYSSTFTFLLFLKPTHSFQCTITQIWEVLKVQSQRESTKVGRKSAKRERGEA